MIYKRILTFSCVFLVIAYNIVDIPYFFPLILLNAAALFISSKNLKNTYNESFRDLHYEFRLRGVTPKKTIANVFGILVFLIILIGLIFIIPWPERGTSPVKLFLLNSLFWVFMIYINSSDYETEYYYFTHDSIIEPGYDLDKIPWEYITGMDVSKSATIFWLNLRDEKFIKFDMDKYATGMRNEDILKYVRSRMHAEEQQFS